MDALIRQKQITVTPAISRDCAGIWPGGRHTIREASVSAKSELAALRGENVRLQGRIKAWSLLSQVLQELVRALQHDIVRLRAGTPTEGSLSVRVASEREQ